MQKLLLPSGANILFNFHLYYYPMKSPLFVFLCLLFSAFSVHAAPKDLGKITIAFCDSVAMRPEIYKIEYAYSKTKWKYKTSHSKMIFMEADKLVENADIKITRITGEVMEVRIRFNTNNTLRITEFGFQAGDKLAYMTTPSRTLEANSNEVKMTLKELLDAQQEEVVEDAIFLAGQLSGIEAPVMSFYPNRVCVGDTIFIICTSRVNSAQPNLVQADVSINEGFIDLDFGLNNNVAEDLGESEGSESGTVAWRKEYFIIATEPGILPFRQVNSFNQNIPLTDDGSFIIVE